MGVLISKIKGKASKVTPPKIRVAPLKMLKKTIITVKTKAKVFGCSSTIFPYFSLLKKFKTTKLT
jgi:hypothetical protein